MTLLKSIVLVLISTCTLVSCNKINNEPACIQEEVENFEENALCNTGSKVKKYKFQGEFVYVFEEGSCVSDGANRVIDASCHELGWLGGIMGNQQINGVDFEEAKYIKTIMNQ